jgi:hypothetical protein
LGANIKILLKLEIIIPDAKPPLLAEESKCLT